MRHHTVPVLTGGATGAARFLVWVVLLCLASAVDAAEWKTWRVDFEQGDLSGWRLTIPEDWEIAQEDAKGFLRLKREGPVGADPRRPVKFAFWEAGCVASFELSVRVRRQDRGAEESDVTLAFGFQDKTHFYYTHLSRDDGHHRVHNGLFRVNGSDREKIAGTGARPALPDSGWHVVRIVRDAKDGSIEVWVDSDREPRFQVRDTTFAYGLVGLGSFDNRADFDNFELRGEPAQGCRADRLDTLDRR